MKVSLLYMNYLCILFHLQMISILYFTYRTVCSPSVSHCVNHSVFQCLSQYIILLYNGFNIIWSVISVKTACKFIGSFINFLRVVINSVRVVINFLRVFINSVRVVINFVRVFINSVRAVINFLMMVTICEGGY